MAAVLLIPFALGACDVGAESNERESHSSSRTHPLRPSLETKLSEIFSSSTVQDWMKGLLTSDDVVSSMALRLDGRFRDDFLFRRLDEDVRRMQVNVELFTALRGFKSYATVVLATDNMDCFARTFAAMLAKSRQPSDNAETLAAWATVCDDYICSYLDSGLTWGFARCARVHHGSRGLG